VQGRTRRAEAKLAALIPIPEVGGVVGADAGKKRRKIFEDKSHHIASSLKFLPAIARQLYHWPRPRRPSILTWFEYGLAHEPLFEELVGMLRETRRVGIMSSASRYPHRARAAGCGLTNPRHARA